MNETLKTLLTANELDPDLFAPSGRDEAVFQTELPSIQLAKCWGELAKGSGETKYWPIIRGSSDRLQEHQDVDASAILARIPIGGVREILADRSRNQLQMLREMMPELPNRGADAIASIGDDADLYQMASAVDASGIHSFVGANKAEEPWPEEKAKPERFGFHTLKSSKGKPAVLQLIRVDHSYDVPAHLGFGGWNDCPLPEIHVALLREWRKEYDARPACITGDVIECVVARPPQTRAQAMQLAAEQWIYCDDIVGQGTQSIRNLALEIWKSPTWFFWWD